MPRALAHFKLSFKCIAVNYNCTYLGWSQQLQSMFELFRVITTLLPKYLYPGSLKRKSGPRSFGRILISPYSKGGRLRATTGYLVYDFTNWSGKGGLIASLGHFLTSAELLASSCSVLMDGSKKSSLVWGYHHFSVKSRKVLGLMGCVVTMTSQLYWVWISLDNR